MRFISLLLILTGFSPVFAQKTTNFWSAEAIGGKRSMPADELRANKPSDFETFALDFSGIKKSLRDAPLESKISIRSSQMLVELPTPDGGFETFRVVESPILPKKLGQKYPEIHTFNCESTSRPGVWGKLDIGALGFHGFIFEPGRTFYIEPMAIGSTDFYHVFDRKNLPNTRLPGQKVLFENESPMKEPYLPGDFVQPRGNVLDPVSLRRFKFALTATGEYSAIAGNTPSTVMAAVVNTVNRFNGIFERDFAMHFDLVDNVDTLFFYNPATDPFNPVNVLGMADSNKDITDARIGPANYDCGHVFGKAQSGATILGVAGGNVCTNFKARAASTDSNPLSDNFIVTVCQEIEHQFIASHTWNRCGDPAGGLSDQFAILSAFEPGSGSTIVSYAGICGSDDVKSTADDYNHSFSIQQVREDNATGNGALCADVEPTSNNQPTATLAYANGFYVPISTPFRLTGAGSDAEDVGLTYLWEQMDLGPQSPLGQPIGSAPLFRSYPATSSPTRIFPKMATIVANQNTKVEVLPTIDRPLNFRLTVLDNHPAFGGQHWAEVSFRSTPDAGPFRVTVPNALGIVWKVDEFQQITWDVANTKQSLVNCQKVNIKLSNDGGFQYPVTLATNEDNDGSAWIKVPNNIGTTCRVMVEAADNIFFDISNTNFKIEAATIPSFSTAPFPDNGQVCTPSTFSTTLNTSGLAGFSGPILFSTAGGLPVGATATFASNNVNAGTNVVLNIDFLATVAEGNYPINIDASANGTTISRTINLTVVSNNFGQMALLLPADGDAAQGALPNFSWQTVVDADNYVWEIDETPAFNSPNKQTKTVATGATTPVSTLIDGKAYYWRVRPTNVCGAGDWVGPFSFGTKSQSCQTFENTNQVTIPASGTPSVESSITSNFAASITDVNIVQMTGSHDFFKDIDARLLAPSGTEVILFKSKCGNSTGNFKFGIDDQAAVLFLCPPTDDQPHKADQTAGNALANFNGQSANGVWKLKIKDVTAGSGGQLSTWKLQVCGAGTGNPPVLVNKLPTTVIPGTNQTISTDKLLCTDPNNSAGQLIYTLVSTPKRGDLRLNGGAPLLAGSQFSQAQIDGGALGYFHFGGKFDDAFTFTVIDGEGGFIGTTKYDIFYDVTAINETQLLDFQLVPNPATDQVSLLRNDAKGEIELEIRATTGQLLLRQTIAAGQNKANFSVSNLPQGVYFVSIKMGEKTGTQRLVKN
jgi:subtilisin-like proprotein convertase family protein